MEKLGAMTVKTNLADAKSLSGSVPMDGLNFDLGGNNEFMDLLDMAGPDLQQQDENRSLYDFSSMKPLPDDFLGFDFESDAADKWPALTTDMDSSYDF
ncbi:MAG: hypothetical protein Q9174_005612, partial [Haloplaca sp. 1 TL-2023]